MFLSTYYSIMQMLYGMMASLEPTEEDNAPDPVMAHMGQMYQTMKIVMDFANILLGKWTSERHYIAVINDALE